MEHIKYDDELLKYAAGNMSYSVDGSGTKYEFSREMILAGLRNSELMKKDTDKTCSVISEFVK